WIALLTLAGLANAGAGLVGPWAIGRLVDRLPAGAGPEEGWFCAVAVAVAGIVMALGTWIGGWVLARIAMPVDAGLGQEVFHLAPDQRGRRPGASPRRRITSRRHRLRSGTGRHRLTAKHHRPRRPADVLAHPALVSAEVRTHLQGRTRGFRKARRPAAGRSDRGRDPARLPRGGRGAAPHRRRLRPGPGSVDRRVPDRKSTRLNSSHVS